MKASETEPKMSRLEVASDKSDFFISESSAAWPRPFGSKMHTASKPAVFVWSSGDLWFQFDLLTANLIDLRGTRDLTGGI